jgi:hypothetical protein
MKQQCMRDLAWTQVRESYGRIRACSAGVLKVHGKEVPYACDSKGLHERFAVHLKYLSNFFSVNEKEPESSAYYQQIRSLADRSERQVMNDLEIPDLPEIEELLGK